MSMSVDAQQPNDPFDARGVVIVVMVALVANNVEGLFHVYHVDSIHAVFQWCSSRPIPVQSSGRAGVQFVRAVSCRCTHAHASTKHYQHGHGNTANS